MECLHAMIVCRLQAHLTSRCMHIWKCHMPCLHVPYHLCSYRYMHTVLNRYRMNEVAIACLMQAYSICTILNTVTSRCPRISMSCVSVARPLQRPQQASWDFWPSRSWIRSMKSITLQREDRKGGARRWSHSRECVNKNSLFRVWNSIRSWF